MASSEDTRITDTGRLWSCSRVVEKLLWVRAFSSSKNKTNTETGLLFVSPVNLISMHKIQSNNK